METTLDFSNATLNIKIVNTTYLPRLSRKKRKAKIAALKKNNMFGWVISEQHIDIPNEYRYCNFTIKEK